MSGIFVVLFLGIIVGFAGGDGVREIISRRRRAEERLRRHGNAGGLLS